MTKETKVIKYNKYQQGDVVMFQVDDKSFKDIVGNPSQNKDVVRYDGHSHTHAILAFGEATGHKHQVNMENMVKEAGVTLNMGYNRRAGVDVPEGFQVHDAPVKITHEEHKPIELPPGYYMVRIVREHDHIAGRTGYVAD